MLFSSMIFLWAFLPVTLISYYLLRAEYRNYVLLAASLFFYAWGEPVYILLMLCSILLNYLFGIGLERTETIWKRKSVLISCIIVNLGLLWYFKYSSGCFVFLNKLAGCEVIHVKNIILPIGISFYTFQAMSYVIDLYRKEIKVQKNILNLALYISFFPQLIAGPIVKYKDVNRQLENRIVTEDSFTYGIKRFVLGLGKKVILSNTLAEIADSIFTVELAQLHTGLVWFGVLMYTLQIYFDFSGYSDMAIGIGRIFGFKFNENFRYPFMCKDVTEFWQRWHISLGTFFRDYVLYIPIFGKRRKFGGLFLVWILTGLWHGASWNFLIWGLYYGVLLAIEMIIGKKTMKKIPIAIRHIYNKIVIVIGFCIFYFTDLSELGQCLKSMFFMGSGSFTDSLLISSFKSNVFLIIAAVICCFPILENIKKRVLTIKDKSTFAVVQNVGTLICMALLIISGIFLVNATSRPFLYLQF